MKLDKGQHNIKVKNNTKKKLLVILGVGFLLVATAVARLASYVNNYYEGGNHDSWSEELLLSHDIFHIEVSHMHLLGFAC